MKTASILCAIVTSLVLSPVILAQRTLDETEIRDILKKLTDQPQKTWIDAGTIEATHHEEGAAKITDEATIQAEIAKALQEYQLSTNKRELTPEAQKMAEDAIPFNVRYQLANTYSMDSTAIVKYDGERFYWEINVNSRSDSVTPDAALAANDMTDEFDMDANKRRIFAWDGYKYTTYSASSGHAFVDTAGMLGTPRVTGPLTAGLIPWGYEKFSYENLLTADISAMEITLDKVLTVQMTIAHPDGTLTEANLDPSKGYAVTSVTLTAKTGFQAIYTLSGYKSIANRQVPSMVVIERKNDSLQGRAPSFESWAFDSVSTDAPSLSGFSVPVAMDATIEYTSPAMTSSAIYTNSYDVDTDELLAQRLAYGIGEKYQRQNCATAALQNVAVGFGKPISNTAVAGLVGSNGLTSLYEMKRFTQSLGLYSRIVKTDLAGLKNLGSVKAILHIPGKNHFVVFDRVDGQNIRLIDLSSRKFYYRQSIYFFPLEWTEGTALLLSDQPITGQFTEVPDTESKDLIGGTYYLCNRVVQEFDCVPCDPSLGLCQGDCIIYWYRMACGSAESGTCEYHVDVRKQQCPCVPDPSLNCTPTWEWSLYSMLCCE